LCTGSVGNYENGLCFKTQEKNALDFEPKRQ
jgi:hypothetical protein